MTHSDAINELAAALSKAQAVMAGAKKDGLNPHFKSKYADLASVWDACREALTANGLSVMQTPRLSPPLEAELGPTVAVETMLLHSSGQWMRDTLDIPLSKPDAQGVGSAITYARRYALAAFVGVAPEDDDGNAAVAGQTAAKRAEPAKVPTGYAGWLDGLTKAAGEGTAALQEAWRKSPQELRNYLSQAAPETVEALKKKATSATVAQ